jgi:hypothetical protein
MLAAAWKALFMIRQTETNMGQTRLSFHIGDVFGDEE